MPKMKEKINEGLCNVYEVQEVGAAPYLESDYDTIHVLFTRNTSLNITWSQIHILNSTHGSTHGSRSVPE